MGLKSEHAVIWCFRWMTGCGVWVQFQTQSTLSQPLKMPEEAAFGHGLGASLSAQETSPVYREKTGSDQKERVEDGRNERERVEQRLRPVLTKAVVSSCMMIAVFCV